ncbi:mitochondrial carrier protein, putative [Theileria equi strain WA]|uniref:Mitochondrial carrier protein, putative n=1 Tax=Theileria equi strain WA TaxID=1537102 RepID=L1LBK3_THEEQ|nr:mitochondrial carrier protein, putative [Theileria equi strain WA]EKX72792.1 mitochondrial carrier protein, putative [Theileria equi strain WA]|eukprot:XP_004832244.1 mitochondrial carrier protein, putative [Theileria equi strain WA]
MDHIANVICGGIAGLVADLLIYPLDTLKTRSQVKKDLLNICKPVINKNAPQKGVKRGAYKYTVTGRNSLYSGLGVLVCGDLPSSAAFYGVYEFTKDKFNAQKDSKEEPKLPLPLIYFIGSTLGQVTSLVIRNPFEVVKQQMQAGIYSNASQAFCTIHQIQGVRGLYAGFFSTLMREIPFDGIQFILWEKFKAMESAEKFTTYLSYKANITQTSGNVIVSALCGSFAGGVAGAVTMPLDVAKTRMMTQGENRLYKSTFDCLSKVARDEGSFALFKGLGLRVSWLTLGGFVFFAALEAGKVTIKPLLIDMH